MQLIAGSDCQHTAYTLPSASITLDGNGSTLDGTGIVPTGTLPILSGADVQGTTIKNLTFVNGSLNSGDGAAIDLTGDSHPTLNNDQFYANSDTDFSGFGGAVALKTSTSTGTITVENSTFGSIAQPNSSAWVGAPCDPRRGPRQRDAGRGNQPRPVHRQHRQRRRCGPRLPALRLDRQHRDLRIRRSARTATGMRARVLDIDFEAASPGTHPHMTVTGSTFAGNTDKTDVDASGAGLDVFSDLGGGSLTQVGNTFSANRISKIASGVSNDMGAGELAAGLPLTSIRDRFIGNAIAGSNPGDTPQGGGLVACNSSPTATTATIIDGVIAGNAISGPAPGQGAGAWIGSCYGGKAQALALRDSTISGNVLSAGTGRRFERRSHRHAQCQQHDHRRSDRRDN